MSESRRIITFHDHHFLPTSSNWLGHLPFTEKLGGSIPLVGTICIVRIVAIAPLFQRGFRGFEPHTMLHFAVVETTGLSTSLSMRVMRVRVPSMAPLLFRPIFALGIPGGPLIKNKTVWFTETNLLLGFGEAGAHVCLKSRRTQIDTESPNHFRRND